jgi:dye decolorizing peroxidase
MSTRRTFIKGALIGGAAATAAMVTGEVVAGLAHPSGTSSPTPSEPGVNKLTPLGLNQPGIASAPLKHTRLIAFDLKETAETAMSAWMSLLADDIDRLMSSQPLLADPQPELSSLEGQIAIVVGFGPSLFKKLGIEDQQPLGFSEIPSFAIDNLQEKISGGDVLLMLSGDDVLQLANAERALIRDSSYFASIRWQQSGFSSVQPDSSLGSQRNLMGQIDGTASAKPGAASFGDSVWAKRGPNWHMGGTTLVYRKIAMQLDTWDKLDHDDKEKVIGRKLSNGAPLNKSKETDFLDLTAKSANGLPAIPTFAHVRQAQAGEGKYPLFRKPFNYVDEIAEVGSSAGLLWMAYVGNMAEQYLPLQEKLATFDLLNKWTQPIGSAVFALPKGRLHKTDPLCGGLFS